MKKNFPRWPLWFGRKVVGWAEEQKEAWRKQIFEDQTWRQIRGFAGAAMCETRDGHQVPQRQSLPFEGQEKVGMRSALMMLRKCSWNKPKRLVGGSGQPNTSERS